MVCENLGEGEKIKLGERRTLLVKNSLVKVKKGAVLFESRKAKAKVNDKRTHYNHETKAAARMVTELLVLDKGSGEAVALELTLNMEEENLTMKCFGEDRGELLLKIFVEPFLVHLQGGDEGVLGEVRSGEESWRAASNGRNNDSWRISGNSNANGNGRNENSWRLSANANANANFRQNDSWRFSGNAGETRPRRREEGGEGKVMEHWLRLVSRS